MTELDQTNPFVKVRFTHLQIFQNDNFDFNFTHSFGLQQQRCGKTSQSWIQFTSFRGNFKDIGELKSKIDPYHMGHMIWAYDMAQMI